MKYLAGEASTLFLPINVRTNNCGEKLQLAEEPSVLSQYTFTSKET